MLSFIDPLIPPISQSLAGNGVQATLATAKAKAKHADTTSPTVSGSPEKSSRLSTLAQQLSDSALRAEERDSSFYKELPPIMQAQYPEYYAPRLEHLIKLDFNFITHRAEGTGSPEDVFEILMLDDTFANIGKRLANSIGR